MKANACHTFLLFITKKKRYTLIYPDIYKTLQLFFTIISFFAIIAIKVEHWLNIVSLVQK